MCFMKIVMDSNWCFNFVIILDKSWTLELGQKGGTSTSQLGQGCILYYFWGKTSSTNNQVHPTIHNLQEDTEHKIHWHGTQASKTLGKNGTQNWNLFNHLCFTQLTLVDFFKHVHNILHYHNSKNWEVGIILWRKERAKLVFCQPGLKADHQRGWLTKTKIFHSHLFHSHYT